MTRTQLPQRNHPKRSEGTRRKKRKGEEGNPAKKTRLSNTTSFSTPSSRLKSSVEERTVVTADTESEEENMERNDIIDIMKEHVEEKMSDLNEKMCELVRTLEVFQKNFDDIKQFQKSTEDKFQKIMVPESIDELNHISGVSSLTCADQAALLPVTQHTLKQINDSIREYLRITFYSTKKFILEHEAREMITYAVKKGKIKKIQEWTDEAFIKRFEQNMCRQMSNLRGNSQNNAKRRFCGKT